MSEAVLALLQKARQALADAGLLADHGRADAAINRAYYAAFHAARAALLSRGEAPKSHKGVRTRFDYHFVGTGRLPREVATVLGISETARLNADYDVLTIFDARAAADLIADVERFVEAVALLLADG